jgi:hypothetical protein
LRPIVVRHAEQTRDCHGVDRIYCDTMTFGSKSSTTTRHSTHHGPFGQPPGRRRTDPRISRNANAFLPPAGVLAVAMAADGSRPRGGPDAPSWRSVICAQQFATRPGNSRRWQAHPHPNCIRRRSLNAEIAAGPTQYNTRITRGRPSYCRDALGEITCGGRH